jgi:hypothetical protein
VLFRRTKREDEYVRSCEIFKKKQPDISLKRPLGLTIETTCYTGPPHSLVSIVVYRVASLQFLLKLHASAEKWVNARGHSWRGGLMRPNPAKYLIVRQQLGSDCGHRIGA